MPIAKGFLGRIINVRWRISNGDVIIGGGVTADGHGIGYYSPDGEQVATAPPPGYFHEVVVGYPSIETIHYPLAAVAATRLTDGKFAVGYSAWFHQVHTYQEGLEYVGDLPDLLTVYNADGSKAWGALTALPFGTYPGYFTSVGAVAVAAATDGGLFAIYNPEWVINELTELSVRKYAADGTVLWTRPTGLLGSCDFGADVAAAQNGGCIVVVKTASEDPATMQAYDTDGALLWSSQTSFAQPQSPVLAQNATQDFCVCCTIWGGTVDAFDLQTGNVRWSYPVVGDNDYLVGADIGADGNVFVLIDSFDGEATSTRVEKLSPTGKFIWSKQILTSGPLSFDSTIHWSGPTGARAIAAPGNIFVVPYLVGHEVVQPVPPSTFTIYEVYDVKIHAFDQDTGEQLWEKNWGTYIPDGWWELTEEAWAQEPILGHVCTVGRSPV